MPPRELITLHLRFIGARLKDARTIISLCMFALAAFMVVNFSHATTPNPGHPWTDLGNGTFQVANTQTALRTFTFPDASANVLTDASAVTVAEGGTGAATLAADGILFGNGTGAVGVAAAAANSVLATNGSNVPALTATLPAAVQTNITSTGALNAGSIASGFGNINIGADIFTGNGSGITALSASNITTGTLGVAEGGTGDTSLTSNNLLVGAGTSAVTFIAPSATVGSSLVSNGTTWQSQAPLDPGIYTTVGLYAAAATGVTALTTGVTYFQYVGVTPKAYSSCNVLLTITTSYTTATWAEVALFSGAPVLNGNASLTRLGFTSEAPGFNTTGSKSTAVTATIPAGTQLWAAYGSAATTPFQVRGMIADTIQTGVFQTATVRPSTASSPQATTLASATAIPGWLAVKCQ